MEENLDTNQSQCSLYTPQQGAVKVDVLLKDKTVWITQDARSQLFRKVKSTVSEHPKNVFIESELMRDSTARKFRTVADLLESLLNYDMLIKMHKNAL